MIGSPTVLSRVKVKVYRANFVNIARLSIATHAYHYSTNIKWRYGYVNSFDHDYQVSQNMDYATLYGHEPTTLQWSTSYPAGEQRNLLGWNHIGRYMHGASNPNTPAFWFLICPMDHSLQLSLNILTVLSATSWASMDVSEVWIFPLVSIKINGSYKCIGSLMQFKVVWSAQCRSISRNFSVVDL